MTLGLVSFYLWFLPLLWPRGEFLWGYYRLKDIYLGIPAGLTFLCILAVLLVPHRYRRSLALRLASVTISVTFTLFLCDAVYALVVNRAWEANFWLDQAHISRKYSVPDEELGFARKPGISWTGAFPNTDRVVYYRTDENGFRNPNGVDRADVVFIGDSFTEGATVEEHETFVRRAGAASGLSVVNLGRGAYGPQQELIVLKRHGLAYSPRVVVWQLFEGNDLEDARAFREWQENSERESVPFTERYFDNSLFAAWIPKVRRLSPEVPLVRLNYTDKVEIQTTLRYRYDPEAPSKNPMGWAETTKTIEQGYRLCEEKGIKLLVVLVPAMVRVMEPYLTFEQIEHRRHYLPGDVDGRRNDFSAGLAEFCEELGCSFIDAYSALRQAAEANNRRLYILVDEHLDVRGNEVVAQAIAEWLRAHSTM